MRFFFFFQHRPDQIITVRMGRNGGIPLPLEPLWNGSNTHADRKNKHFWPEAARWSEHLQKNKSRGVQSTPSYYGNSHLRLTYVMVVVKTAAKRTRSRSAFGGLGSFHVPAWTFTSPLTSLFLLRFAPFFHVQPGVFMRILLFYLRCLSRASLPQLSVTTPPLVTVPNTMTATDWTREKLTIITYLIGHVWNVYCLIMNCVLYTTEISQFGSYRSDNNKLSLALQQQLSGQDVWE